MPQITQHIQQQILTNIKKLLGAKCIGCGIYAETPICNKCYDNLQKPDIICTMCGIEMMTHTDTQRCSQCIQFPHSFHSLNYIATYDGLASQLIVGSKIAQSPLALTALQFVQKKYLFNKRELHTKLYEGYSVLAMPTPKYRLAHRGFNLAHILAKQFANIHSLPLIPSNTVKTPLRSKKQALLSKKQRYKNKPQYTITAKLPKNIVLIDDVATTGQTVEVLSQQLKQNGVESIAVWTFARAKMQY